MKIVITGATGLIGSRIVAALKERGDEVTALSRNPAAASAALGVEAVAWNAAAEEAPVEPLSGADAVINLAGEPVDQRWSAAAKEAIRGSRVDGTANLVAGMRQASTPPKALVSGSAVGWYGARGHEEVDESEPSGEGFLASVCNDWEDAAGQAREFGVRTVTLRTGVVLAADGGALRRMLPPFKAGIGGPVGSGSQMMPWIHIDDVVWMAITAATSGDWTGPINATAPTPVTNRDFSKALGGALHRPSVMPVPSFAIKALYGEMAEIVLTGQNAVPRRAGELGFSWRHPDLAGALADVLGR